MPHWAPLDIAEFRVLRREIDAFRRSPEWARTPKRTYRWAPAEEGSPALLDFQKKLLRALKMLLGRGESISVLDYHHECFRFTPDGFKNADAWRQRLWSDGDALDIVGPQLRFGLVKPYPEPVIHVFGAALLDAWKDRKGLPLLLGGGS